MEQWQKERLERSRKKFLIINGENISASNYPEKRDCYSELYRYVTENEREYSGRICALYGLRRTGKTVMMHQCIESLDTEKREKSVYINCNTDCEMLDLRWVMDDLYEQGKRYFFIDEITMIEDLQLYGNTLSDYYRIIGAKVVVAGTDSFGLYLARTDVLYDRMICIHTSQVSYAEYARLCEESLDCYIEYGGTLTNTTYKNNQSAEQYLNTAIVNNILHGLESREEKRRHATVLTELYERDELVSVIQKMINTFSYDIAMKAVKRSYKSAVLYATINNTRKNVKEYFDDEMINQAVKSALGIKNLDEMKTALTKENLETVKNYLKLLDLFLVIPSFKSYKKSGATDLEIFQQPGMLYAHATELLEQLRNDEVWNAESEVEERESFLNRADHFVKGILLENIILSETYQCYQELDKKRFYVSQLSIGLNEGMKESEADLIILDKEDEKTYLFEIKYSDQVVENQTRHLRNEEFLRYVDENFAPVEKCCVIYNGQPTRVDSIDYLNAEKFLQCIHEMHLAKSENLEKLFQQEEIEKNIKTALEVKEKSETKPKEKKVKRLHI